MRHLGSVRAEEIEVSALASLINLLQVNEVGTLDISGQQFEIRRFSNSRTFVARSNGTGIANGSNVAVAMAVVDKVRANAKALKVG